MQTKGKTNNTTDNNNEWYNTELCMIRDGEKYIVREITFNQGGPNLYVFKNRDEVMSDSGPYKVLNKLLAEEEMKTRNKEHKDYCPNKTNIVASL